MSGKSDQVKGRAKEAAGVLTGNEDLESEGRADRLAGEAKGKVDDVVDSAKSKVDDVAEKVKDALDRE